MNTILNVLQGKKTYATAIVVAVLLFGQWQKWWVIAPEVYAALCAAGLAFLRAGVSSEIGALAGTGAPDGSDVSAPADGRTPNVGRPGGTGPILPVLALVGFMAVVLVACASFNATVFNAEKTAADTAAASVHAFNQYYHTATNTLTATQTNELASLNMYRDNVYGMSKKLSATLNVLDQARASYVLNAADTNKTQVEVLLSSIGAQSTNIVNLVKSFLNQPRP